MDGEGRGGQGRAGEGRGMEKRHTNPGRHYGMSRHSNN